MRVFVETVLDCPPELVWDEVQTSALLIEVAWPIVRFAPAGASGFPARWSEGVTLCRPYLFGLIPLGEHRLVIRRIDADAREIESRERDPLVRRWDHLIRVREVEGGRTLYADDIDIEAGLLTPVVWLFAQWFYRHRQSRWRRIARRLVNA